MNSAGGTGGAGALIVFAGPPRPPRTGYIDERGMYHPGPSYRGFDEHADGCPSCYVLRVVADDYVDRRPPPVPRWARDVPIPAGSLLEIGPGTELPPRRFVRIVAMPIPGGAEIEMPRLGLWQRFAAWLRFRPAAWPVARLVRR